MKNIQLQLKELQALGALAGPDLAIMEAALSDPFTMRGAYYGQQGLLAQIARARQLIDARKAATAANVGGIATPAETGAAPAAPQSVNDLLKKYGGTQ